MGLRRPGDILQKRAHRKAVDLTVEHFKTNGVYKVGKAQVRKCVEVVGRYAAGVITQMHTFAPEGPSLVYFPWGYARKIFPELFINMHKAGEFTDEEFEVIRNELYKNQFDTYYQYLNKSKHGRKESS